MLERPVLLHGRGHRDGEMLDWNCGRKPSAVMDIDINIRQELVTLLSGSGYGGQQQQQQQVIKKSKACMNVELFAQRSSSTTTTTTAATCLLQQQQQQQQKEQQRPRQQLKPPEEVVACPRCQSLNTKFCYYNNYSLTQPRHFCKNCRRYWTAGGTLRNVPVGGGCRKIKRSSCKSSTTTYHHLHQHQHQQHTAAALAANSDHAAIIYDSPPPAPGHGFIAHHGILDTFNCDNNTHAAAAAAAVQWLQQQQHTPMSSFATILHDQSKDLELMQVPAAAAGLSSCIDDHRLLHDSQQQQQPLQESYSITNRLGGLFHSVQQQHPDVAAVNSSCRHINASGQHDAAALCSSTVGLDDFQSSVNFVDNSSSRCSSRAEAGVCNYNIQLPSERRLVAAAHDQQGNTTTTTLMPSHNDNTNSRAAESWRVVLQIPKQEEQEQEEDTTTTTTTLQSWPPVHEEHTTLQQAGSLDLNSFKQDHHMKAMKFFHAPSSLSLPSCTHRLGEEEEEESEEAQCVEQHERPGAAAPGATAAPAAATASWHHYVSSASQHHVAPGMPQCYEAVTAPPAVAAADTLSTFWSNPSWSHLDLHTLCGSGPGATLL